MQRFYVKQLKKKQLFNEIVLSYFTLSSNIVFSDISKRLEEAYCMEWHI